MATRGSAMVGVGALAGVSLTLLGVLAATELWSDVDERSERGDAVRLAAGQRQSERRSSADPGEPSWQDLGLEPAHVIDSDEANRLDRSGTSAARHDENSDPNADSDFLRVDPGAVIVVSGNVVADAAAPGGVPTLVVTTPPTAPDENDVQAGAAEADDSPAPEGVSNTQGAEGDALAEDEDELGADEDADEALEPVECGDTLCDPDMVCCNASCNICTVPGGYCDTSPCEMDYLVVGELCGLQSCPPGSVCCCNEVCIAPGQECDPDLCDIDHSLQLTVPCGLMTLCDEGEVCCNASCGICTEPGETCSQELCP